MTSAERERSRTRCRNSSTTETAASASSSAVRMSPRAFSTCCGCSLPLERSFRKTPSNRPVNVSNIGPAMLPGLPREAARDPLLSATEFRLKVSPIPCRSLWHAPSGAIREKDHVVAARSLDLEQARRLEKGLVAVRWFGVAFALFQVSQDNAV